MKKEWKKPEIVNLSLEKTEHWWRPGKPSRPNRPSRPCPPYKS